jgi:hypothetical protein
LPCQKGMKGCRRDCLHRALVREYRDAADAREALRESATPAPSSVPGAGHSGLAMYQLEREEFDAHVPPVLFKDWLIEKAAERQEPT